MTLDPETIACTTCNLARLRRKIEAEERRAMAIASLPGARIAFGLERAR